MNKVVQRTGIVAFWIGWPGLWLLSRFGKHRTRVIVICGQQVLIVKDWIGAGKFSLPGGGLKLGEDPKTCALRELKEETGIELKPTQLKDFGDFNNLVQSGMKFHCKAFYAVLTSKPELKLQHLEIVEAKWIPLKKMGDYNINPAALKILQAFSSS